MEQPKKSKSKVLYDAVSQNYDVGTYEEFETKLQDPAKRKAFYDGIGNEYDLGSYTDFEKKVVKKKEPSVSTSQPQKQASVPKNGSSDLLNTDPFNQKLPFSKTPKQEVAKTSTDKPQPDTTEYPEGSMAWNQQKLLQSNPDYDDLYQSYKSATTVPEERVNEIRQEVESEASGEGFMNRVKSAGRSFMNYMTTGVFSDGDVLAEEKKQARAEAGKDANPQQIADRAKEIAISKRVKSEKETLEREYLKESENTTGGPNTMNNRQKLLVFESGRYSTLKEKDKQSLDKQNILRGKIESSAGRISEMNKEAQQILQTQNELPDDFKQAYEQEAQQYRQAISEAIETHEEYVNTKEELGDSTENLDVFKRDYSWGRNFLGNLDATMQDMSSGVSGAVDYMASMNPSPRMQLLASAAREDSSERKKSAEQARSEIMKPIAVEDINSMSDFGSWLSNTVIAQQIPIYATIATGAPGVAAIGVTSAGQKYEEMRDEVDAGTANYSELQMRGIPLAFGATETASAMVDRMLLKNASRVIRSADNTERKLIADSFWSNLKDRAVKTGRETIKGAAIEGLDETGTQLAKNLIDIYAGDKTDVNIWDNVTDAAAAGAVMGAFIPFGSNVVSPAVKPFTTDIQIQKNASEILRLQGLLNNPELSETAFKSIEKQISSTETKLKTQLTSTATKISNMSDADFQEIVSIEKSQAQLKETARELNTDPTIDDDTREVLLDSLKEDFDATEQKRLSILNTTTNEAQQKTAKPEAQPQAETQTQSNEVTITDETIPTGDIAADGNIRTGTEPMGEVSGETQTDVDQQEIQPAVNTETGETTPTVREYRLGASDTAKPYTVALNNGRLDIKDSQGKEPSAPTRRKLEEQYADDFDFTSGDIAPETSQANINPTQYLADNSNNPAEIAQAILETDADTLINENIDYKDRIIAENIGEVSRSSFIENSDANNIGMSLAKSYLRNTGRPIDTIAQEMSEIAGVEITEQDILDFMLENPNGPQSLISKTKKEALAPLRDKFTQLTGLPANEKYLQKAVGQQSAKNEYFKNASSLDFMSDEELLSLSNEIQQSNEEEITNPGAEDSSQAENIQTGREGSGVRETGRATDNRSQSQEGEPSTINDTEQASVQERNKSLVTERIKPQRRTPKNTPKKLNRIIADAVKGLKATLIYGRSGRARSLGTYNPSNALVRITREGDIDTTAHELGHLLDDRFNILGTIPSEQQLLIDNQLKWFSDRGGSNPPAKLSPAKKAEYIQREGLAEFIRAYISNPEQANIIAPELYTHFENSIDDTAKNVLQRFSEDFIDYANASYGDQMLSNVEDLDPKNEKKFKEWLERFKGKDGRLNVTPWDSLNAHLLNSMGIANKAFSFLSNIAGEKNLLPEKNFELISRLFAGINGKTNRILSSGLVDSKNNILKDKDGNAMTVNWLLEPLDNTSEQTVKQDMDEVIKLLVAERTLEYAKKFSRLDNLTGIGGGVNSDIDVAQGYLDEFNQLKEGNKEKYNRIKEAADRYRQYADTGLKYAVEKGRISKDQYRQIKDSNQYYVSLARVKENAPMEEEVPFFNENAGGIASVKDVIKKAKGGTDFIQNPYISLLQNTVNIIKESDRNEVLNSFIEPLQKVRQMGDGTPVDFSQIARPAHTGDKNTKTIFVDGEAQRWQFAQDIYDSLTSLEAASKSPLVDFLAKPADVIRFTVTNFPTFALRNAVRDTSSRLIISRTNSGFKDLIQNASDKELFELYGGSQAGFYLVNKDGYKQKMKETVKEITNSGGIVLDPRHLYRSYRKLLERGENLNRIAEFKSAYRKAKKQGMDDYNAGLYAAFQARDLMDFAVAGHTVRNLNRFIPFLNAGIQGLRRTSKAVKEDPAGFAVRTAIYTVLPTIAFRYLVSTMGDEEEYEELPAYQRDLFWMFKTPFTGDTWIAIPKPFEQGMVSSVVDRGISQAKGVENAWQGFGGTVSKTLMPVEESSILGGLKPIIEAQVNYNTFTDRTIVPAWEDGKLMELRKTDKASRVGQGLSEAFKQAGWEVDPRKVDHVITGYGTYMADWGLSFADLGVEDSNYRFGPSKTGFARDVPMNNSKSVSAVYELATELGAWGKKDIKRLRGKIEKFYEEEDAAKRDKLSKEIYADAKELRKKLEADKKEIKEEATD